MSSVQPMAILAILTVFAGLNMLRVHKNQEVKLICYEGMTTRNTQQSLYGFPFAFLKDTAHTGSDCAAVQKNVSEPVPSDKAQDFNNYHANLGAFIANTGVLALLVGVTAYLTRGITIQNKTLNQFYTKLRKPVLLTVEILLLPLLLFATLVGSTLLNQELSFLIVYGCCLAALFATNLYLLSLLSGIGQKSHRSNA